MVVTLWLPVPQPVNVTGSETNCGNQVAKTITVNLSTPIVNGGTYQIILRKGNDGNTLIDECAQETPVGSSISFAVERHCFG